MGVTGAVTSSQVQTTIVHSAVAIDAIAATSQAQTTKAGTEIALGTLTCGIKFVLAVRLGASIGPAVMGDHDVRPAK